MGYFSHARTQLKSSVHPSLNSFDQGHSSPRASLLASMLRHPLSFFGPQLVHTISTKSQYSEPLWTVCVIHFYLLSLLLSTFIAMKADANPARSGILRKKGGCDLPPYMILIFSQSSPAIWISRITIPVSFFAQFNIRVWEQLITYSPSRYSGQSVVKSLHHDRLGSGVLNVSKRNSGWGLRISASEEP